MPMKNFILSKSNQYAYYKNQTEELKRENERLLKKQPDYNFEKGISVIIPSYKGENHIKPLLDSLENQTLNPKDFELLFVINGPLDSTAVILKEFMDRNKDYNVIITYTNTPSEAKARNIGISLASREYTTFIDDDDFVSPNYLEKLLEYMCPVHEEPNLMGARWSKLLINATFSGLGTVVGGVFGDVSENKAARKVAIRCMKECIDVGHAAGVEFAPVQGKNIVALFYYKGAIKRAIATLLIPIAMKKHRNIEPSMLQDLKKGKACEIDAINGVVCEWGRKCGVKTPFNDKIVEIIRKCESGELSPKADNIKFFDDLI